MQEGVRPTEDDLPALLALRDSAPSVTERAVASLNIGALSLVSGKADAALPYLQEAFEQFAGSGRREELVACNNLALALRESLQFVETLAISRRAARLADSRSDAARVAIAQSHIVASFLKLEDVPRSIKEIDALSTVVSALDSDRRPKGERVIIGHRFELGVLESDAGIMHIARNAAAAANALDALTQRAYDTMIAAVEGRHSDVLAHATEFPKNNGYADRVQLAEIEAQLELGRIDAARQTAQDALARASRRAVPRMSAGRRLALAQAVHQLAVRLEETETAQHALDLAGSAALERVPELKEFAAMHPDVLELSTDDERALADYRERVRSRYRDAVEAASRFITNGGAPNPRDTAQGGREGQLSICAWCGFVSGPDGMWFDVGEVVLPPECMQVTHGICEPCHTRALELNGSPTAS